MLMLSQKGSSKKLCMAIFFVGFCPRSRVGNFGLAISNLRNAAGTVVDHNFFLYIDKSTLETMVKAFGKPDNGAQLRFVKDREIYFYAPDREPPMDAGHIEYFLHGHRFVNRFPTKH